MKSKNFPDKPWLIRAVSYISKGRDEIFEKSYTPAEARLYRGVDDVILEVHNNDGLLDIPASMIPSKSSGRTLSMAVLDNESKLKAKLFYSQQRVEKAI